MVPASMNADDRAGLARLREAFPAAPTVTEAVTSTPAPVLVRCAQCHQRADGRTPPLVGRVVTLEDGWLQAQRLMRTRTASGRNGPGYSQPFRTPDGWSWRSHDLQWLADDARTIEVECRGWCQRPTEPMRKGRIVAAARDAIDRGLGVAYV